MFFKKLYAWLQRQLVLSMLLLLFCSFWSHQAQAWNGINKHANKSLYNVEAVGSIVNLGTTVDENRPDADYSHLPLSPVTPITESAESSEKKDNQESGHWRKPKIAFGKQYHYALDVHSVAIACYEQAILKKAKVSLVVLHHSWKIYLD